MDRLVLKFETLEACQTALDAINEAMRQAAIANGLVVTDDGIVGQRNGQPALDATKTVTWDEPREYDGGWVITPPPEKYNLTLGGELVVYDPHVSEEA